MNKAAIEKTRELLGVCNVMSIATCADNVPWAASVFFVADESFNLYFVSNSSSLHSRNINLNGCAAVTINKDHDDWLTICGLQIEGATSVAPANERERILTLYLNKFPHIARLRDNPANDQEKLIADRIGGSDFYRIEPSTVRLIDNSLGFGSKMEKRFPIHQTRGVV